MSLWAVVDYVTLSQHAIRFLVYRLIAIAFASTLVYTPLRSKASPDVTWFLTALWLLSWGTAVALMLPYSGEHWLLYCIGISVVGLAGGVLPVWPVSWAAASVLSIGTVGAVGLAFRPDTKIWNFIDAGVLYTSVAAGALVAAAWKVAFASREFRKTQALLDAASQLESVNESLREAQNAKKRLYSNVSHELRTPIATLGAALANVPLKTPVDPHKLVLMRRNVDRLMRQVDDILHLAKAEGGSLRLHPQRLDGGAEAERVCSMLSVGAEAKGIRLTWKQPEEPLYIRADKYHLETVLTNLVGNAIKYTEDGGRITVRGRVHGRAVRFEVADTGIGIPESQRESIFGRFVQVGTKTVGGVGIGLSLARELVELHGGEIGVDSTLGRGSTFWFTIPRSVSAPQRAKAAMVSSNPPNAPPVRRALPLSLPPVCAPDGTRMTVLVVDDDDDLRSVIHDTLRSEWNVVEARDGIEGVEKARKHRPDVIVTDMEMPRLGGDGLIADIRSDQAIAHTPIICLTARNTIDDETEILGGGADDYIAKPFSPEVLRARVRLQLRIRALVARLSSQDKLALVGTFAGGVLHEVNNPASRIVAAASLLTHGITESQMTLARQTIEDAARRIVTLTSALRTHASPEDPDTARPFAIKKGLESTLSLIESSLEDTEVELDCSGELEAYGVPAIVNHVVLSLIDNARKSGATRVVVTARSESTRVVLEVQDNGPGIPPDLRERVFDPFFTRRPVGGGTGLGLFLCRNALSEIGGSIAVGPSAAGARMVVQLPKPPIGAALFPRSRYASERPSAPPGG